VVIEAQQASTSFLQRKMRIGYNRAARIMDQLEEQGVISGRDGSKPRQVLRSSADFLDD
jgi:S-DNA-T family DNA segregation ATPase FtsK/SpoIIIE